MAIITREDVNKDKSKEDAFKKQQEEWDKLYKYVRKDIMGYSDEESLSKDMVLKLKGLMTGKYIANNKIKKECDYDYDTVYLAFLFSKIQIDHVLNTIKFKDDNHKLNYILKIVEPKLSTIQHRKKQVEESFKEVTKVEPIKPNNNVEYKKKGKRKKINFDSLETW